MRTKEQIDEIVRLLLETYPEADCTLDYGKDYELLFSVRLAAQCTDERVNKVTPALFERFPTLEAFAAADVEEVERYIHSTGFFRAKARDIVACAQVLLEKHGGRVPARRRPQDRESDPRRYFPCPGLDRGGHALHPPLQPHRAGGRRT